MKYQQIAEKHSVSVSAVQALAEALRRGNGTMAQFDHPELGGRGQWMRGGMTQIGDMFNDALKAKVNVLVSDILAEGLPPETRTSSGITPMMFGVIWWPAELGTPSSTASQNDLDYALFPSKSRLATRRNGVVTVYDTVGYAVHGVSGQQQGSEARLAISTDKGRIPLEQLPVIGV